MELQRIAMNQFVPLLFLCFMLCHGSPANDGKKKKGFMRYIGESAKAISSVVGSTLPFAGGGVPFGSGGTISGTPLRRTISSGAGRTISSGPKRHNGLDNGAISGTQLRRTISSGPNHHNGLDNGAISGTQLRRTISSAGRLLWPNRNNDLMELEPLREAMYVPASLVDGDDEIMKDVKEDLANCWSTENSR
ncbi:hypothetical protein niasHT_038583 [Heterodera trifolii]|uniref:Uncharacterized protein n=1 Tax=Heterodera trifolii TaxID=157864 RepID=A0ABD2I6B4_9BILA